MNLTILVTILILVAFYIGIGLLNKNGRLPGFISLQFPMILLQSERGKPTIHYVADRFERFWKIWGFLGVVLTGIGLVLGGLLVTLSAIQVLSNPTTATLTSDPKNLLVIPGLNDYLPLSAAPAIIIALLIGMIVHELGHAILCRVGDIEIESTGIVFLSLIPAGAFVQPNEESNSEATNWARIRMISGGIMNNLAISLICLLCLILLVSSVSPVSGGAVGGITQDSPANESTLEQGDVITEVNGISIDSNSELTQTFDNISQSQLRIQTKSGENHTIERQPFVVSSPRFGSELNTGDRILQVGEREVRTQNHFISVLNKVQSNTVPIKTQNNTIVYPVGARGIAEENSKFARQFENTPRVIIYQIEETRIHSSYDLENYLSSANQKQNVTIQAAPISNPEQVKSIQINIRESEIGMQPVEGYSGVVTSDNGITVYPTETYIRILSNNTTNGWASLLSTMGLLLVLPLASLIGFQFNFAGFTPEISNFVTVNGLFSQFPSILLFVISVLYWTIWLNINLALFNAIPTFALDGGKYAKITYESTVKKIGVNNPTKISNILTKITIYAMLICLLIVALYPYLSRSI